MENTFQTCGSTKYTLEVIDGVICLVDLDMGMSITNNAQAVIAQLKQNGHDLIAQPVIYQDTEGTWDWLQVNLQGVFSGFRSLGNDRHRNDAIREVKRLTQTLA